MGVRLWSGDGETLIQGNTITNNACGIILGRDATHTVTNVSIVGNDILNNIADTGILVKNGSATGNEAHFNNIVGNDIGVKNEDPDDTFDATNNWWGDASGPSGVGHGTGDAVSANVDYDPWLGAPLGLSAVHHESLGADTHSGCLSGSEYKGNLKYHRRNRYIHC